MKHRALYQRLAALAPVPEAEWSRAMAHCHEQRVGKRELFLRPGDPPDRFGVVLEGVFRAFRVSVHGQESVKAFRFEGQLLGAYAEALQGIPSLTGIEALEPSRVLVIHARALQALEAGHACWSMLARRVAEQHFILKEQREQEFLDLTAEERLESFERSHPGYEGRVPLRDVAAYLGITDVALSRIRSRRKRRRG